MANARTGNKIFIDSTGAAIAGVNQPVKVAYILFTPAAADDELLVKETSSGENCLYFRSTIAKTTMFFDFSYAPILFNNGIYIETLTSGAKAVFITTQAGS